ncbi:amidase [Hoyosella altamirensis]|uniref:Aspartyl-tRNA(Asn)/glutamyl-tRNA(Gln) amidotransferase subunit A n=1 Tax=Hoyosella altamirensis TaxID=616997 RepID=A0A839RPT0_9ACTN|nr:amidase [Hoyosella altamirensis]MBB3037901.1 aspartyl-tRNA(Asn)/glutamyl-tRNA(Gln) amidotransferase subunit A [Hoyosella altamirensis]
MKLNELAARLGTGQITAREHIEHVLKRINDLNGTPWENLIAGWDHQSRLAEAALEQADALDAHFLERGPRGPLHGVPVAVKDLVDVAGFPTRCGSGARNRAAPATRDADIVRQLHAAGAIIVAKTHLHEFAYGPTGAVNVDGPAANPRDPRRITGGSSSGSAGLVALGIVPLAIGTDTGCSVRTPAALCGITGLKPAAGALSTAGVFPLSTTLDHVGLLADTPTDAAFAWHALTGHSSRDAPRMDQLTIGRLHGPAWTIHDAEAAHAVDRAAEKLRTAGAVVVDVDLPHAEELIALYGVITGSEAYATHEEALRGTPDLFQPITRERLLAQRDRLATEYIHALRRRDQIRDECFVAMRDAGVDAVLTSTTPLRATAIGVEEVETTTGTVQVRAELLRMCIPFSMLGVPAVSVPAQHEDGLPSGVQIAAFPKAAAAGVGEAVVLALGGGVAA